MSNRTCILNDCDRPFFGRDYCSYHYYKIIRAPRRQAMRMTLCPWCDERKNSHLFRHPTSSRGKSPTTCNDCRDENPDQAWCDFHGEPHEKSAFSPVPHRPLGVGNECIRAMSIKASRKRGHDPITCVSCGVLSESSSFRGGRQKCPTCRDCEAAHPDEHYCADCADWMPKQLFASTGKDGRYMTVRCRPCRTAHNHGVTVKWILAKQGSTQPECACCGSEDFLKIDHDHSCCPTSQGCEQCVRGYLCHECNTAEGLLRTPDRAILLAGYMQRANEAAGRTMAESVSPSVR